MSFSAWCLRTTFRIFDVKHGGGKFLMNGGDYSNPPDKMLKGLHKECRQVNGQNVFTLYKNKDNKKAILYLHGGSYINSFAKAHWKFLINIANKTNRDIIAPDYPLVPRTYKESYEMVIEIYNDMLKKYNNDNIIIMGDSAGGGFALGFCMYLRDNNIPLPQKNIMISPYLDMAETNPDIAAMEKNDPWLSYELAEETTKYAGEDDLHTPYLSPMYGELDNLNDMYIFFGTYDMLYPDGIKFKKMCEEKQIKLKFTEKKKMMHVYPILPVKEAKEALKDILEIINEN